MRNLAGLLAKDWAVIDGPETVTLSPRVQGDGYGPAVVVTSAQTRGVEKSDLEPELLAKAVLDFHLWASRMTPPGAVPRVRDRLVRADGSRWQAYSVEVLDEGGRFKVRGVRERP